MLYIRCYHVALEQDLLKSCAIYPLQVYVKHFGKLSNGPVGTNVMQNTKDIIMLLYLSNIYVHLTN